MIDRTDALRQPVGGLPSARVAPQPYIRKSQRKLSHEKQVKLWGFSRVQYTVRMSLLAKIVINIRSPILVDVSLFIRSIVPLFVYTRL